MKVIIAGYNIDSSLIRGLDPDKATPEAISAAYARISRSEKAVDALRDEALAEVEKARRSNRNIIFEMGHASVAEHAVFNIDLIGISRHLTETVQRSRLASFTEKSQRYVTFQQDFIIPAELEINPDLKDRYIALCEALFSEYQHSMQMLLPKLRAQHPDLPARDIEGMAKEDARYILPLATKTQMGMTINARGMETLLRRLHRHPSAEAATLYTLLHDQVAAIAPSLIRYTQADDFDCDLRAQMPAAAKPDIAATPSVLEPGITMLDHSADPDAAVLSALAFAQGIDDCPEARQTALWDRMFQGMKPWHKMPRAFEYADFRFTATMSECCWGQFKRHRTATMLRQRALDANQALIIPANIIGINRSSVWQDLLSQVAAFRSALPSHLSHLAPYASLNAEVMRVLVKMNLREIYHFVRLRSDQHAQWEIRVISDALAKSVKSIAPNAARHLCGKSQFCSP